MELCSTTRLYPICVGQAAIETGDRLTGQYVKTEITIYSQVQLPLLQTQQEV